MGVYENVTFGNVALQGLIFESYADNLVAHAGGGQGAALLLASETNRVITAAASVAPFDSVKLPATGAGQALTGTGLDIVVINHSTNPIQVFGSGTDTIDDVTSATGVTQMANSIVLYFTTTAGQWYTEGLASGFVRGYSLQTFSSAVIAANVGGTQGTGTPLIAMQQNITAAGANYSTVLPPSTPGMDLTMHNVSSFAMLVFPNTGDTINGGAANAALSMPANTSCQATCNVAGAWFTVPRVPS